MYILHIGCCNILMSNVDELITVAFIKQRKGVEYHV